MERLTERTADGILVKEDYGEDVLRTLYQCYGAEPMPHYANCDEGYCAMEKLAEYEDLEEQGKLMKLPYALNDAVYYIDDITPFEEMPIEGRISGFRVTWCGTIVIHITTNFYDGGCLADRKGDIDVTEEDFGKTVFTTREEAEDVLKEL